LLHQNHLQYTGGLAETQGLLLPSLYHDALHAHYNQTHTDFSVLFRTIIRDYCSFETIILIRTYCIVCIPIFIMADPNNQIPPPPPPHPAQAACCPQEKQQLAPPVVNSNKNKMTCMFCSKQSHHQEECRKRINTNQPCLDSNGFEWNAWIRFWAFWPKINTTNNRNGALIQALQDQDVQYWAWWNPYIKLLPSFLNLLWVCGLFLSWLIINFQKLWCLWMGETK